MLAATVDEAARRFGARPAFVAVADADGSGPTLSYRDLAHRSDVVAAALAHRGVGRGDVVALALPPGLDFPVCYAALARVGAIAAGVNLRLAAEQRAALLDAIDPVAVVGEGGEEVQDLLEVGGEVGGEVPSLPDDPDRPVAIVFTSGTAGTPRGAVFGGRQLAAITAVDVGGTWGGGGRSLAATSFAHLGFMTKLPATLRRGGTVHVLDRWDTGLALALIERLALPTVAGVPAQLALLLARPELAEADLSAVLTVVVGGGPATPVLVRRAREAFGAPVCVRYSCTEAGIGTGTRPDDPPEDAELTVGRPQPGVEVSVRGDPEGPPLPPGETGEVWLRSGAVMDGYWRDPAATAQVLTPDRWVRTGDLGALDEHGRLHLTGRSREIYIRGGENVSPVVVESVLSDHPAVQDVAVVAVPDEVMGEVGVAVVVARAGRAVPTVGDLRAFAADRLARHELPERVVAVATLPLTAGDKVDRRALREVASVAPPEADTRVR